MGFFDLIGNAIEFVAKPVIGFATGGVPGAVKSAASITGKGKVFERSEPQQMNPFEAQSRNMRIQNQFDPQTIAGRPSFVTSLGQTIGNFGRDVGGFVSDIAPALSLFGVGNQPQRTNAGTAISVDVGRPQESASSGEILGANLGLAPALFQAGRNFLRTPGGQTALGFGAGAIGSALMDGGNGMPRITRRMKSDVRKIYMMAGMDPNATAQILNNLGTYPRMNFDASLVFFILTKRFRNDGPVVTKAAVRKTKTTLRRMKGVVDMYNSVCKPTTRRAPARRAAPKAVQLIKN